MTRRTLFRRRRANIPFTDKNVTIPTRPNPLIHKTNPITGSNECLTSLFAQSTKLYYSICSALIYDSPANNRIERLHLHIAALINPVRRLRAQEVRVNHCDIGQFAFGQCPFDLLLETGVGRTPGIRLDSFFDGQTLGGVAALDERALYGVSG